MLHTTQDDSDEEGLVEHVVRLADDCLLYTTARWHL